MGDRGSDAPPGDAALWGVGRGGGGLRDAGGAGCPRRGAAGDRGCGGVFPGPVAVGVSGGSVCGVGLRPLSCPP
jgi:hypothetical protein